MRTHFSVLVEDVKAFRIPCFTQGWRQLSPQEVDTSRRLSNVRIHLERTIGRMKNFKILTIVIPLTHVDCLDDMMTEWSINKPMQMSSP